MTESKADDGSVRQAQRLLELVDGFNKKDLDDLLEQERKLKLQIQDAFTSLRKVKALDKELKRLQQEHQDLERQWKARCEIQEEARSHQLLKSESRYLEGLLGTPGKQFSDVAALAETVAASHIPFTVEESPHEAWFFQFDGKVKAAKDQLAKTIYDAVEQFNSTIEGLKANDPAWTDVHSELEQADEKVQRSLRI